MIHQVTLGTRYGESPASTDVARPELVLWSGGVFVEING